MYIDKMEMERYKKMHIYIYIYIYIIHEIRKIYTEDEPM